MPAAARAKAGPAAGKVNYLLYLPAEYSESQKWPLVVFLHGGGAIGDNLLYVRAEGPLSEIERGRGFPFILLSPQCPVMWWNAEMVVELIDHVASTLPVDRDRVYLTGCSMGGYGTWDVAGHFPDRFAAIAPICGAGDVELASRLAKLPIRAFHGAKDNVVPLVAQQRMVDAVKKCGGNVTFIVDPEAGHNIADAIYADGQIYEWLLSQRRNRPRQHDSSPGKEASRSPPQPAKP